VDALESFVADVRGIFGDRLHAIVVYEAVAPARVSEKTNRHIQTLTLVDAVKFEDVAACAARSAEWGRIGLATPLIMGSQEFTRSLDAFPLEYGNILAAHRVILGSDPFRNLTVRAEDLRHACETQAKSHLLHLREAYIEAEGQPARVARIIMASVAPFKGLLMAVAHLRGHPTRDEAALVREAVAIGLDASIVQRILGLEHAGDIPSGDTAHLFAGYLGVVERLTLHADQWQSQQLSAQE
jgi:hypothetical protein